MIWQRLFPLLGDFTASLFLSLVVRTVARHSGALDRPSEHKQHREPIPTMGGIAVFLAFALYIALRRTPTPKLMAVLVGSVPIVGVGLLDDLKGVNAVIKLALLGASTAILIRAGIVLHVGLGAPLDDLATFLFMGFVSSAFNGIDNADGSAAGIATISSFFTFVIAWVTWQHELAMVAAGLGAACLGFLVLNFPHPRASLFLGDTGSFFLGFSLGAMLLMGEWGSTPVTSAVTAVAVIGYPVLDFLFILVVRGLDGRYRTLTDPITMCARDHTYHRLIARGLKPREAILAIYAFATLFGATAVGMSWIAYGQVLIVFSCLVFVALTAAVILARVPLGADVYAHVPARRRVPEAAPVAL